MKTLNEQQLVELFNKYQPHFTDPLKLLQVKMIWDPHTFCVGTKHVTFASEHSGLLNEEAMASAPCCTCNMPLSDHTYGVGVFVEVLRPCENKEAGKILQVIKDKYADDGIIGFAFPKGFELIKRS